MSQKNANKKGQSITASPIKKPATLTAVPKKTGVQWAPGMPFKPINYILMIAGIVVLFIGYLLLSGGGSDDPSQFSEAIFNARRLRVAPITLIIGFVIELFAIMYRPCAKCAKKEGGEESPEKPVE